MYNHSFIFKIKILAWNGVLNKKVSSKYSCKKNLDTPSKISELIIMGHPVLSYNFQPFPRKIEISYFLARQPWQPPLGARPSRQLSLDASVLKYHLKTMAEPLKIICRKTCVSPLFTARHENKLNNMPPLTLWGKL